MNILDSQTLFSSICVRVVDTFGLISKDMRDIRTQMTAQQIPKCWAIKYEQYPVIAKELDDYVFLFLNTDKNVYYVCICCDKKNEDHNSNNIYCMVQSDKVDIREATMLECSHLLTLAEIIRNTNPIYNKHTMNGFDSKIVNSFLDWFNK